jgi:NAD(P)H-dependent flavin oxidoreductase YrpB (nitropropane dioxygenase family)
MHERRTAIDIHIPLYDLLGIDTPMRNAGMGGGIAAAPLASAVPMAGGLGRIGGMQRRGPEFLRQPCVPPLTVRLAPI